MKKIFLYYSLTGNGDEVASYLKDKGYEISKIKIEKELPNNFTLRILTGGFKALINYKEKLVDFDNNLDSYEKVIIGSPIWNARLSTPITTVLNEINIDKDKIDFILYSGGEKHKNAIEYINKEYPNSRIISLKEPKKYKNELKKLDNIK